MIITGGYYSPSTVSVYNIQGWIRNLANLNQGRHYHACGVYYNEDEDGYLYPVLLVTGKENTKKCLAQICTDQNIVSLI